MRETLPLLQASDFPRLERRRLTTLQVNLGYTCNQACLHCHVNAGPSRKEQMSHEVIDEVLRFAAASQVSTLDLTGGAPELNPHFRDLVSKARGMGIRVIDRCNLTVLEEPGQEGLAGFLAGQEVEIVASLPCYLEENVDGQRGEGVYAGSMRALRRLNALGYGKGNGRLVLNLVYNPTGPYLPPSQCDLEADYRRELQHRYGISFDRLLTITNMPIARFGSTLLSKGKFDEYMQLLREAHRGDNLEQVMCRDLISVDWQGYVYDCDFNQMLGLPLAWRGRARTRLADLIGSDLEGNPIWVADHCYGCTAGQGSSCGGALASAAGP
jgi:radical SAM/Cys-rich protein